MYSAIAYLERDIARLATIAARSSAPNSTRLSDSK